LGVVGPEYVSAAAKVDTTPMAAASLPSNLPVDQLAYDTHRLLVDGGTDTAGSDQDIRDTHMLSVGSGGTGRGLADQRMIDTHVHDVGWSCSMSFRPGHSRRDTPSISARAEPIIHLGHGPDDNHRFVAEVDQNSKTSVSDQWARDSHHSSVGDGTNRPPRANAAPTPKNLPSRWARSSGPTTLVPKSRGRPSVRNQSRQRPNKERYPDPPRRCRPTSTPGHPLSDTQTCAAGGGTQGANSIGKRLSCHP
jgi:hypothetical protein